MPVISMFLGIIVRMYFSDTDKHHKPHIHVSYQGQEAVVEIPNGEVLEGSIQRNKMKAVQVWVDLHQDELMANWELAINGEELFRIEGLR